MENRSLTRKLYYENSDQKEFTGLVTAAGEDDRGRYVLLDQTLFFPEGGGQPSDRGTLNGIPVKDVQIIEGEIRHYIKEKRGTGKKDRDKKAEKGEARTGGKAELQVGDTVKGEIDWERRFDLMQQHSGEHIVSGWIHSRFGYDNVGFHMGEKFITIDLNGEIDPDQLVQVEGEVNRYIWQDRPVRDFMASEEEIRTLPYRSKLDLEEEVRLIEFPGADLCACCGLHVKHTGQIGLVKLVSVHRFRQGVRIEMVSGRRAFDYLNAHCDQNSRIAVSLSAKPEGTFKAVDKLKDENFQLRGHILRLEREKYERIALKCRDAGNVLVSLPDMTPADIRKCTDEILNVCGGICVFVSGDDRQGYRYAAGVREGDIRDLVKDMNQRFKGRGGGKSLFAQGSFEGPWKSVEAWFNERGFAIVTKV